MNYTIGIDLGTTNSVLAYRKNEADAPIETLKIPQLVAANTVESRDGLPSFTYLATASELDNRALDLPWATGQTFAVGSFARGRSADAPDRTVGASKSWLCHDQVDRSAEILPAHAAEDVKKISPVTAAQQYLEHLVAAWHAAFPSDPISKQQVVLTVPASFDPAARELTRQAAMAAGLPEGFVLLEEPQAALYAWLEQQNDRWRDILSVGQSILVCDVGGGTTDLALISVEEDGGNLSLGRVAVGDHLLVGGDNMDLAAAHFVSEKLAAKGTKLNPWQSVSLWHSCRNAKESLLVANGPAAHTLTVLGRGSKLIGSTISIEVPRQELGDLLLDGFFPKCELTDSPQRQPASGFQEIGLPYESDPGITRHIAAFIRSHCLSQPSPGQGSPFPDYVLFNGGVFKADGFRKRLISVMSSWNRQTADSPAGDERRIQELAGGHDLDFAVAKGACFYGWNKFSGGIRIRGGVANSYYLGIETAGLAIPGAPRPMKALCVVPFGMEEGTDTDVPASEIGLVLGQRVKFRFFRSNNRKQDRPGTVLDQWTEQELTETTPLSATLENNSGESYVPVTFRSKITELGMFELWCVNKNEPAETWKLEFNVRDDS